MLSMLALVWIGWRNRNGVPVEVLGPSVNACDYACSDVR
jgi:hypothetical protein